MRKQICEWEVSDQILNRLLDWEVVCLGAGVFEHILSESPNLGV